MMKLMLVVVVALVLAACGKKEEQKAAPSVGMADANGSCTSEALKLLAEPSKTLTEIASVVGPLREADADFIADGTIREQFKEKAKNAVDTCRLFVRKYLPLDSCTFKEADGSSRTYKYDDQEIACGKLQVDLKVLFDGPRLKLAGADGNCRPGIVDWINLPYTTPSDIVIRIDQKRAADANFVVNDAFKAEMKPLIDKAKKACAILSARYLPLDSCFRPAEPAFAATTFTYEWMAEKCSRLDEGVAQAFAH